MAVQDPYVVEEQDPNEIEFFEFTLPGVYERIDKPAPGTPPEDQEPRYSKTKLEVHRLPLMQYLGVDLVEKMERGGIADLLAVFGGNAAAIRRLNGKQTSGLMKAWRDRSAVGTGESEAS